MNNVININGDRENISFTETKASDFVPILMSITKKTKDQINILKAQLEVHKFDNHQSELIENEIHNIIQKWGNKITRLGMTPIGIWKVLIPGEKRLHLTKDELPDSYEWEYPASRISASKETH